MSTPSLYFNLNPNQQQNTLYPPMDKSASPCGACKFLRRKCIAGCIFAPHFPSEQGGAARFATVHRVFGASNAAKMLGRVPVMRRSDAVMTICYEAQARLADPVYGCVSALLALQHQVSVLQTELSITQSQLIHNQLAMVGAHQTAQQVMFGPQSCSNNNTVSNNAMNMNIGTFPSSNLDVLAKQSEEEEDGEILVTLPLK